MIITIVPHIVPCQQNISREREKYCDGPFEGDIVGGLQGGPGGHPVDGDQESRESEALGIQSKRGSKQSSSHPVLSCVG